jgi:hypothetical protein
MNRRPLWLPCVGMLAVASVFEPSAHAQPSVVVRGDAACPSAEMILAALPAAASDVDWSGQTVTVEVTDDRLSLTLGDAAGARREIPADADCAIRAESVAVVIAAWSGELGARPSDSPMFTIASPAPVLTRAKKPSHIIEVDGAAFYSPVWGHGPGASLDVSRRPWRGHVGARALLAYQSARDVALEGGTNQILRLLVGATVTYQLPSKRWFAAGDVGLAGTLTLARGAGYEPNETASAANFGGIAELRGGLRLGRFSVWLNARGLRLIHGETVKVQSPSPGVADSAALSAWDMQLGLGLGFRFEQI